MLLKIFLLNPVYGLENVRIKFYFNFAKRSRVDKHEHFFPNPLQRSTSKSDFFSNPDKQLNVEKIQIFFFQILPYAGDSEMSEILFKYCLLMPCRY